MSVRFPMNAEEQKYAGRRLLLELELDERNIEARKKLLCLERDDLRRVASVRNLVIRSVDACAAVFFDHVASLEEGGVSLTGDDAASFEAEHLMRQHLVRTMSCEYGREFVEESATLGVLFAQVRLAPRVVVAAFHQLLQALGTIVLRDAPDSPQAAFERYVSLEKVMTLDLGLIVEVLMHERDRMKRQ